MNQRRSFPWAWVILGIILLVVVAAIAYWAGSHAANPVVVGPIRPFRFYGYHPSFFGLGLGSWLIVLALAVLIGLLVAAIARPSRAETDEEWHRRQHEQMPAEHGHEHGPSPSSGPGPTTS